MRRVLAVLGLLGVVILAMMTFIVPVASTALQMLNLAPGDDVTVTCGTSLSGGPPEGQQVTLTCAPRAAQTPTPVQQGRPTAAPTRPSQAQSVDTLPPVIAEAPQPAVLTGDVEVAGVVAVAPADLPDTLALDASSAGSIALAGGQVVVAIPAGAGQDAFSVSITALDPDSDVAAAPDGFAMGGTLFQLTATDALDQPLTSFDQSVMATVLPSADDLATVSNDLSQLTLAALDPEAGGWLILPTAQRDEGTLSASLDHPAVYALVRVQVQPSE